MPKYFYRYWCDDCVTVGDKQGCFDGGTEEDDERFSDPELAYSAGLWVNEACGLWEFEVVCEETHEVVTFTEEAEHRLYLAHILAHAAKREARANEKMRTMASSTSQT